MGSSSTSMRESALERRKFWFDTKVVSEASYEAAKTYDLLDRTWGTVSKLMLGFTAAGTGIQLCVKYGLVNFPDRMRSFLPWMALASSVGYAVSVQCKFAELSKQHQKVGALYGPIARASLTASSDEEWEKLRSRRDEAELKSVVMPRWVYGYASHLVLYKKDRSLTARGRTISAPSKWRYFWFGTSKDAFGELRELKEAWETKVSKMN